jgi:hypothetical protein
MQAAEKLKYFEIETSKVEKGPEGKVSQVPIQA